MEEPAVAPRGAYAYRGLSGRGNPWPDFARRGEKAAICGLAARLDGMIAGGHILRLVPDKAFALTWTGVVRLSIATQPRLAPAGLAQRCVVPDP